MARASNRLDPIVNPCPLIDHPVVYAHELPVNGASWNHVADPGSCHVNKEPTTRRGTQLAFVVPAQRRAQLRVASLAQATTMSGAFGGPPLPSGSARKEPYPGGRPGEPPFPTFKPWRHASDRDRTRPPPPPLRPREPPRSTRRTPRSSPATSPACASFGASPT